MDQYGVFSVVLAQLNEALQSVRSVWTDKTAQTYDSINENMEEFARAIWGSHEQAAMGDKAVRDNYNAGEFDGILSSLGSRISGL